MNFGRIINTKSKVALVYLIIFLLLCSGKFTLAQKTPDKVLQIDPFYLKLLDEGRSAFNNGDYEQAIQDFKIAAFGLLDAPDLLGEALVYLTVCAYNLKKNDQVEYYLQEISRFKLGKIVSGASLPPEIKDAFARIRRTFKNGLTG